MSSPAASALALTAALILLLSSAWASPPEDSIVLCEESAAALRDSPDDDLVNLCEIVLAANNLADAGLQFRLSTWLAHVLGLQSVTWTGHTVDLAMFMSPFSKSWRPWRLCRRLDAVTVPFLFIQHLLCASGAVDAVLFGALLLTIMTRSAEFVHEAASLLPLLLKQALPLSSAISAFLPLIDAIVHGVRPAALNGDVLETFQGAALESAEHGRIWTVLQLRCPISKLVAVASRRAQSRNDPVAWSRTYMDGLVRFLHGEFARIRWSRSDPMRTHFSGRYRHAFLAEFLYRAYSPEQLVSGFFYRRLDVAAMDLSRFADPTVAKAVFPRIKAKLLERFNGRMEIGVIRRLSPDEALRFIDAITALDESLAPQSIARRFVFCGGLHRRILLVRPDLHRLYLDRTSTRFRLHILIGQYVSFSGQDPYAALDVANIDKIAHLVLVAFTRKPVPEQRTAPFDADSDAYQKAIVELVASTATAVLRSGAYVNFFEEMHKSAHFVVSTRVWELLIDGLYLVVDRDVLNRSYILLEEMSEAQRQGRLSEAEFEALSTRLWWTMSSEDQVRLRCRFWALFRGFRVRSAVGVDDLEKLRSRYQGCFICLKKCFSETAVDSTILSLAMSSLVKMPCGNHFAHLLCHRRYMLAERQSRSLSCSICRVEFSPGAFLDARQ